MENLNEVRIKNRFKLAVKRALQGYTTGQDVKAIIEFQLREYISEGGEPFNDIEIGLMASYMVAYN